RWQAGRRCSQRRSPLRGASALPFGRRARPEPEARVSDDPILPPLAPPPESTWPPENLEGLAAQRRKFPRWSKWVAALAVAALAGRDDRRGMRRPQHTLSP